MFNPAGGCNLDGFAASCSFALSWVNNGAAEDEGFVHCLGPACIFGSPSQSGGQGSPSTHETGHQGGGGRGGNASGLFSQFASYNFGSGMNQDLPSIGDFVVNVPISFQSFSGMDLFISSGGTMIIDELSGEPQNYAQQRQDLKGATKVPDISVKREYLTDCVQKYLAKFFGGQSLSGIEVKRDYLPPIAPSDAAAFTNTGSQISFNKGEYQPNTKEGIALIGHEIAHIFQARKYGDALFGALYLGDSAALLYQYQNLDMAYLGNRFEKEAFAKQAEIEKDLAKNGNPCPP